jgi:transcriptional regulator with XRE-family HTH domain
MYAVADTAQSVGVGVSERARKIQERLDALGISDREFAERTGIDRKALRRAANGEAVRGSTYTAIETWLTKLEREVGEGLPPGVVSVGDPADNLFAVEVYTPDGVIQAIVKGPVKDADAIIEAAQKLMAKYGPPSRGNRSER